MTACGHPIPVLLSSLAAILEDRSRYPESRALTEAVERITAKKEFGGLGLGHGHAPSAQTESQYDKARFIVEGLLLSLRAETQSRAFLSKILAQHLISTPSSNTQPSLLLQPGNVIRVRLDWVLSSELSWQGMSRIYEGLGSPGIWRNDRFWLASDHVVHPSAPQTPNLRDLVKRAERAAAEFKMTEYQGMNYTIMHTEFVRERAEPGMLAIGADSHTCSAGAVGCLAIGLGAVDVLMGLMLGETWVKVPECIFVGFRGRPAAGISGKEVILHILRELKRNTVASERVVEFGGDGARFLSCDARFTICNMATEFGAISGCFVPDAVTRDFICKRRIKRYQRHSLYFRPDEGAPYAGRYEVDLGAVEHTIALYPSPDNVVPVSERSGLKLDGVFIGACTTTEEELVLAALVLKVGLQKGLRLVSGKRHYVPGSLPIVDKLESMGLLDIYSEAGFTRGPPGCSYCLGLSVDRAGEGETWLSSQNRNFQNRMGKGSFGHLSSAVVCAASSFTMRVTDPRPFLEDIDQDHFLDYKARGLRSTCITSEVPYVEPRFPSPPSACQTPSVNGEGQPPQAISRPELPVIKSKIARLGSFIDTDALAPGPALTSCVTDEDFGNHVLEYTHPEFRDKVHGGQRVVVADHAFGCGSSREVAVSALKGIGVEAVIARSYAFIFCRNMRTLGLPGFTISDETFYDAVADGDEIEIDVEQCEVVASGKTFNFELNDIEKELIARRGVVEGYKLLGSALWEQLTRESSRLDVPSSLLTHGTSISPSTFPP
ncbi:hypothetical protein BJY04DRAFT_233131 [Aspergillus karnatakaensis]|uniref:uncharacterized protein n=1 Tax=Aspergillus karnatakaensis TaxID=1810916 RepID=UPI003CCE0B06